MNLPCSSNCPASFQNDAEIEILLTRRSAVVDQGLPSRQVRQCILTLNILSRAFNWLKSAVDAAASGKGVSAQFSARVNGNGVHGVLQLVSRVFADLAAAAGIIVVESFIGSQILDQGKVSP